MGYSRQGFADLGEDDCHVCWAKPIKYLLCVLFHDSSVYGDVRLWNHNQGLKGERKHWKSSQKILLIKCRNGENSVLLDIFIDW